MSAFNRLWSPASRGAKPIRRPGAARYAPARASMPPSASSATYGQGAMGHRRPCSARMVSERDKATPPQRHYLGSLKLSTAGKSTPTVSIKLTLLG